jgi:hypothetical protein
METIENLNPNGIYYAYVCHKNILSYYINNILNNILIPYHQASISGGFFIIHKNKIEWYHKVYYDKLSYFFNHKLLVKDDQYIILHCVANHIKDFFLLKYPETSMDDSWFLFQKFLF